MFQRPNQAHSKVATINTMRKELKITILVLVSVLIIFGLVWFIFFRPTSTSSTQTSTGFFGIGGNVSTTQTQTNGGSTTSSTGQVALGKVFKIADGPVENATFVQTFTPTTTLARYVMQDNGHVFDLAIDVPGAAARPASNTTIPGIASAQWVQGGDAVVMQYIDSGTIKTLYVALPSASTTQADTSVTPVRIQFLPNNITSFAVSPDGSGVAYLLPTSSGVAGYIANVDGTNPKILFSLPLSQVLISWPASTTLMAQTKSAAGVPGIAFSVGIKTGTVTPLLYAEGLSALANTSFSKVVYQTVTDTSDTHTTYSHDVESGQDITLPFNPFPEKCVWAPLSSTILYCAAPQQYVAGDYLDLWHEGLATSPDSIFQFDIFAGATSLVVTPGNGNSAPQEPIKSMAVSPDGHYLLFITRGDQSLWGVRLTQ